jgi:hypothetical protein
VILNASHFSAVGQQASEAKQRQLVFWLPPAPGHINIDMANMKTTKLLTPDILAPTSIV